MSGGNWEVLEGGKGIGAISRYLDAVKIRLGLSSDAELAAAIGFGKSTLATWRRRGAIPASALHRMAEHSGIRFGINVDMPTATAMVHAEILYTAIYTYVVIKYRNNYATEERMYRDLLWWSAVEGYLKKDISSIVREKTKTNGDIVAVFDEIRSAIDRGDFLPPEEIEKLATRNQ